MILFRFFSSLALVIYFLENISIFDFFKKKHLYDIEFVKKNAVKWPQFLKRGVLSHTQDSTFFSLQCLGIVLAVLLIFNLNIYILFFLLYILWLGSIKANGPINGGSDSMAAMIVIGLIISTRNEKIGALFVSAQSCLSYFLAGLVKVKDVNWRQGGALRKFLALPYYAVPQKIFILPNIFFLLLTWLILIFELGFPLVLIFKSLIFPFTLLGMIFHFINFLLFGLNRFFWFWIATYFAMYSLMA